MIPLDHAEKFDRMQAREDYLYELATEMLTTGAVTVNGRFHDIYAVPEPTLQGCVRYLDQFVLKPH